MAVKNDRIRVYLLTDVGEKGKASMAYALQPSQEDDQGYWAGLAYISGRETTLGAQGEHTVIYDVVMDDHVPVENTSDVIVTLLPDETFRVKVLSVGLLRSTGEKIARSIDVSDAKYTLTV